MAKKKKKAEEEKPEMIVETEKVDFGVPFEEVKEEVEKKPKSNKVTVEVVVGTLMWEGGKYEKGETFECSRKRFSQFDPKDVKIVA